MDVRAPLPSLPENHGSHHRPSLTGPRERRSVVELKATGYA